VSSESGTHSYNKRSANRCSAAERLRKGKGNKLPRNFPAFLGNDQKMVTTVTIPKVHQFLPILQKEMHRFLTMSKLWFIKDKITPKIKCLLYNSYLHRVIRVLLMVQNKSGKGGKRAIYSLL